MANKKSGKNKVILSEAEIKRLIDENGELTLQEIGDAYGVTRMRVCQIEKLSLQKLAEIASLKNMI